MNISLDQPMNIQLDEEGQVPNLESEQDRLTTFQREFRVAPDRFAKFPVEALSPVSPQRLARAGFYYCPDAAHEDRCICFCCNRALHSWSPEDDVVYEHCRWSPDCSFVQELLMDNIMPAVDPTATADDSSRTSSSLPGGADAADAAKAAPKEWTAAHGCTWPRDAAIDHLLICVHGVALSGPGLEAYVCAMRKNAAHLTQKYMEERPMMVAVDAIDWHDIHLPPEESLEQITLGGCARCCCCCCRCRCRRYAGHFTALMRANLANESEIGSLASGCCPCLHPLRDEK
jgi:hypothetical protein